jgi:hypothetical protein
MGNKHSGGKRLRRRAPKPSSLPPSLIQEDTDVTTPKIQLNCFQWNQLEHLETDIDSSTTTFSTSSRSNTCVLYMFHSSIRNQVVPLLKTFSMKIIDSGQHDNINYEFYSCSEYTMLDENGERMECVPQKFINNNMEQQEWGEYETMYIYLIYSEMNDPSLKYIEQFKQWKKYINPYVLRLMDEIVLNGSEFSSFSEQMIIANNSRNISSGTMNTTQFTYIPDDCMIHIFQYLSIEYWLTCSTLNHNFYSLFCSEKFGGLLWKPYLERYVTTSSIIQPDMYRTVVLDHLRGVKRSDLSTVAATSNETKLFWSSNTADEHELYILSKMSHNLAFQVIADPTNQLTESYTGYNIYPINESSMILVNNSGT